MTMAYFILLMAIICFAVLYLVISIRSAGEKRGIKANKGL
jgi:hypothetical protein